MIFAVDSTIHSQLRPPDTRTVEQWVIDERIRPPGSARATQMDLSVTPWLREPCEAIADNRNREVVIVAPTGAGKTTVLDASLLRATKEDPGSILLAMQNEADADSYYDERLEPMILGLDGVGDMVRRLPRGKRRKGELVMPHMTCYVIGANIANFQRKSVRYVFLDEVWQIKHGLVAEARGRHHDRWNARVVLTSQGGWQYVDTDSGRVKTELFEAFERSTRHEWGFTCPQCSAWQQWNWKQLKWADSKRTDGSIDEAALAQSTRYICEKCEQAFDDTIQNRRALANAGSYSQTNPDPLNIPARHTGFHLNALTLYYVAWSTLALEFTKATELSSAGDKTALQIFVQKRLAEFWKEEEDDPGVLLGGCGYRFADYARGEMWDGEVSRFLTVDRQRDHFWAVCRAWKSDGSSRLLWAGKILTSESIRELQKRMKVQDWATFQDAQHDTAQVYDDCHRYGWTAFHGSGEAGFQHNPPGKKPVRKFFSTLKKAQTPSGGSANYIFWSNERVKDILALHRAGKKAAWEIPDDAGQDYHTQINSEVKKDVINKVTKQVARRWCKIGSRPNHLWDCEAMQIVAALIKGRIAGDAVPDDAKAENAVE